MSSFALSDLQHAYWLGEQGAFNLTTPACLYRCFFTASLDVERLRKCLLDMSIAHPMMRMRVEQDGTQAVAEPPIDCAIASETFDVGGDAEADVLRLEREKLLARIPDLSAPHKLSCSVTRTARGCFIHLLFRLISFDGPSVRLFLSELAERYSGRPGAAPPKGQYVDFVSSVRRKSDGEDYRGSHRYWMDRARSLPSAPELPFKAPAEIPRHSTFKRRRMVLTRAESELMLARARSCSVSGTVLLCTIFADVLRLWAKSPSFTLNVLVTKRPAWDPDFATVLGNFSDIALLEVADAGGTFAERAASIKSRFGEDMEHARVSGIEVIRALGGGADQLPAMPVVFASLLGTKAGSGRLSPGDLGWIAQDGFLNTPQVLLDHQVSMDGDAMVLNWDSVDDAFLPGVVEDMFEAYGAHVRAVLRAEDLGAGPLLPAVGGPHLGPRAGANATSRALPRGPLSKFLAAGWDLSPDSLAIISDDAEITYKGLRRMSTSAAKCLHEAGVRRNDLVAILVRKNWEQVAAIVSVAVSEAAYLPISASLPPLRKQFLLERGGVKALLVEGGLLSELTVPPHVAVITVEECFTAEPSDPAEAGWSPSEDGGREDDLAYVMFTSGSTGQPKGVAISQAGVVNTIQDVIRRFGLSAADRVIGISEFNFDLSVYDVFATFFTGATLILPRDGPRPDPDDLARAIRQHRVTVWNSVPAILDMLLEHVDSGAEECLRTLRLILLSGDWIPVTLPGRLKLCAPDARVISLGGATEASIWSNYFDTANFDPSMATVPYGWPLSNQTFLVLDKHFRDAPTWVVGELYIGGLGLAKGYYGDPARTAQSFVEHPVTGERYYRTGDLGRYHASGRIEFFGREDGQVKIRGHRIEQGEIEAAVQRFTEVREVAVVVTPTSDGDKQLVAFVTFSRHAPPDAADLLRRFLASLLPAYMVPSRIVVLDEIPITNNGKVDRKSLLASAAEHGPRAGSEEGPGPRDEAEAAVFALWQSVLGVKALGIRDNFFSVGGNSLAAVRLLGLIRRELGVHLSLESLFRAATVETQAALLLDRRRSGGGTEGATRTSAVKLKDGADAILVCIHPVGGNVLCYRELVERIPDGVCIVTVQSRLDGLRRSVADMADLYADELMSFVEIGRPIALLGWSMGGIVALEVAHRLESRAVKVSSVSLIDSWTGDERGDRVVDGHEVGTLQSFVKDILGTPRLPAEFLDLDSVPADGRELFIAEQLRRFHLSMDGLSRDDLVRMIVEFRNNYSALAAHAVREVRSDVFQYRARRTAPFEFLTPFGVDGARSGGGDGRTKYFDDDHFTIMRRGVFDVIWADIDRNIRRPPHAAM